MRDSNPLRVLLAGCLCLGLAAACAGPDATGVRPAAGGGQEGVRLAVDRPAPTWQQTPDAPFRMRRVAVDPAGGGDATLSPDGRRFVTTSRRAGHMDLWIFDLQAEAWTQVTDHQADDFEGRFSPDGKSLVFTSTRAGTKDIWTLNLADGEPRRLTDSPFEDEYPIYSPDGRHVVYTSGPWGGRDFWMIPVEGGERRRLNRVTGKVGACGFYPSGDSLVCHDYGLGTGNLLRMWLDGETVPLTLGEAWDYKPMVSGDGRWIAFSRAQEGPSHIYLMAADGGRPRRLTHTPDSDRWPTWSADGQRLFFHRLVDRSTGLETVDLESGEITAVAGADERPEQADFSADGRQVVYCAWGAQGRELRVRDLAAGSVRTVDLEVAEACYPRFLPDGGLAFAARPEEGARWEVAVAGADGKGLRYLTAGRPGIRGMDGPLDVSPDGRRIVFHADTGAYEADLFLYDLDKDQLRALTDDVWFDEAPSFTADGEGVLFMSTRDGEWTWGLFRLDLADGSITTLAGPDYVEKNYVRPAPGGLLWIQGTAEGREQIVVRDAAGARTVEAVGEGARWASASPDSRRLLYARVEKQVEYWLVDNPVGAGSPALEEPSATSRVARVAVAAPPASPDASLASLQERTPTDDPLHLTSPSKSPVDPFHR